MRPAEFLEQHGARPFLPFTIHLMDGREFFVDHPEFAILGGRSKSIQLSLADDVTEVIDMGAIVSLTVDKKRSPRSEVTQG
jgi:hypothetical protein